MSKSHFHHPHNPKAKKQRNEPGELLKTSALPKRDEPGKPSFDPGKVDSDPAKARFDPAKPANRARRSTTQPQNPPLPNHPVTPRQAPLPYLPISQAKWHISPQINSVQASFTACGDPGVEITIFPR